MNGFIYKLICIHVYEHRHSKWWLLLSLIFGRSCYLARSSILDLVPTLHLLSGKPKSLATFQIFKVEEYVFLYDKLMLCILFVWGLNFLKNIFLSDMLILCFFFLRIKKSFFPFSEPKSFPKNNIVVCDMPSIKCF